MNKVRLVFVDYRKFDRPLLSIRQKEFLDSLIPLARLIRAQVVAKCEYASLPFEVKDGVLPSVIIAHCTYVSNWGKHLVAQDKVPLAKGSWVHGNNLALNRANEFWPHEVVKIRGDLFKSYVDRGAFVIDMSDIFAWTEDYMDVLGTNNVGIQVKLMSKRQKNAVPYKAALTEMIERLGLTQFDE